MTAKVLLQSLHLVLHYIKGVVYSGKRQIFISTDKIDTFVDSTFMVLSNT